MTRILVISRPRLTVLRFDFAPFQLGGTVVSTLLNDPRQLQALGGAVQQAPYKAAPVYPVLAVKPRNTLVGDGALVTVPADAEDLELAASLGIVIGRTACRVPADRALAMVAGYTIAIDIAVPVQGHYRPALRWRARDGFCPVGPRVTPSSAVADPDALTVRTWVDGALVQAASTGGRTRGVARLVADVSDFMTLHPGDLLLLGGAYPAPRVAAGQSVATEIEGLGRLSLRLVAEEAPA
jgi:5-oxopent-3-ene-1,2,5-tricarboxylate decarboxylase/2-hydroxyhepta-2,4-diene-1,7-dioate isomerase